MVSFWLRVMQGSDTAGSVQTDGSYLSGMTEILAKTIQKNIG